MGEGLVMCNDVPDVWRSGTFLKTPQVSALLIANTDCRMTEHSTSDSLGDIHFLGSEPLYNCTEGMCHSSTHPGTSLHVTQFYQAFPHVSTASDKR